MKHALRKNSYIALGWCTWKIGKKVAKRQARQIASRNLKIGAGLLAVAIIGAIIASRSS